MWCPWLPDNFSSWPKFTCMMLWSWLSKTGMSWPVFKVKKQSKITSVVTTTSESTSVSDMTKMQLRQCCFNGGYQKHWNKILKNPSVGTKGMVLLQSPLAPRKRHDVPCSRQELSGWSPLRSKMQLQMKRSILVEYWEDNYARNAKSCIMSVVIWERIQFRGTDSKSKCIAKYYKK